MKKIGVIGLGIMGNGMASNFLKAGHELYVWNRSPENGSDLVSDGAKFLASPKAVSAASDIVFEVVSDDEASRAVWFGYEGILAGAGPEKILITSASLSLDYLDELIVATKEANLQFFDMPLTGGRGGAESGQLSLLVGGDKSLLDSIQSELKAVAAKVYYFGNTGSGMRFKLLLNSLSAIHMNAAAQASALAAKAGINNNDFYSAIFDGKMGPASPATSILVRDKDLPYNQTNFAIKWIEKDLRYAQAMAKKYNVSFDLLNDTQTTYLNLIKNGKADLDWSKITDLF